MREEEQALFHAGHWRIILNDRVVIQRFVNRRPNEVRNLRPHSILLIQRGANHIIVEHSFEQRNVHFVQFRQFVNTRRRSQLLMIAYHDEMLHAERQRGHDVRLQDLGGLLNKH